MKNKKQRGMLMTIIEDFSIKNFRIIRELKYSPKQINIITGRNNTGKSALLSAIAINATGYIDWEFKDWEIDKPIDLITSGEEIANICSNYNEVSVYSSIETLQRVSSNDKEQIYTTIYNDVKNSLKMGFLKNIFNDQEFQTEFFNLFFKHYDTLIISSKLGLVIFPYFKKKGNSKLFKNELKPLILQYGKSQYDKLQESEKRDFKQSDLFSIPTFFQQNKKDGDEVSISVYTMTHADKTSFEETTEEGLIILEDFIKQHDLVKNLKRLSNKNVVYQIEGKLTTIPINSHGDGFISLLNVIRYFMKSRDGILLIEEPENHLHPKYINVFIENLFLYSEKLNIQVFISTHSYDLIQSALKYAQSNNQKELLLISKMTSNGEIIEKIDYNVDDGLKIIDEMFLDLRGN
jgi:AAA15 family ATPase/GTPase